MGDALRDAYWSEPAGPETDQEPHCDHHRHDDRCGGYYDDGFCDDAANDYCVHCECCCDCLGCEYGPRDGMLTYPDGPPPEAGETIERGGPDARKVSGDRTEPARSPERAVCACGCNEPLDPAGPSAEGCSLRWSRRQAGDG